MQICMTSFLATNRLFGKTDKHLTNCLTVPSCLFVCFVSCEFFLGHFSFFSFAGWVLEWLGGFCTGLQPQQRIVLSNLLPSRYIHVCVYVSQLHLFYSMGWLLTIMHLNVYFFACFQSGPVTRERDRCTGMGIVIGSCVLSTFLCITRPKQISSTHLGYLFCVIYALLHAKRCSLSLLLVHWICSSTLL